MVKKKGNPATEFPFSVIQTPLSMHKITATRYPNNEIRVNRIQSPSVRSLAECDENGEIEAVFLSELEEIVLTSAESSPPPLSLGSNSKTQRSSAGYGDLPNKPTMFGLNAKRSLVRSGAALETEAPHDECLFLTGTLPGSTYDAFEAIARYSGYIVNNLKAWIANYVTGKLDFYCWEYQKRGALHLHYCVHIPDRADRDRILDKFREWWITCLSNVGERSNTDLFRKDSGWSWLSDISKVRAVAEVCRKSPARYLAKYLSKSSTPSRGTARAFTPSRWWGVSRPLKALLDSLTSVIDIAEAGYHAICRQWEKVKHVCDSSDGSTFTYAHKFGMGETKVCYPATPAENEELWLQMEALSTIQAQQSTLDTRSPQKVLRTLRDQCLVWSREWSTSLSDSHQGLKLSLNSYSNLMMTIIPSQSPEPLHQLLVWAARTSDIRSLCQFTPCLNRESSRLLQKTLDELEWAIEEVAKNGWY